MILLFVFKANNFLTMAIGILDSNDPQTPSLPSRLSQFYLPVKSIDSVGARRADSSNEGTPEEPDAALVRNEVNAAAKYAVRMFGELFM